MPVVPLSHENLFKEKLGVDCLSLCLELFVRELIPDLPAIGTGCEDQLGHQCYSYRNSIINSHFHLTGDLQSEIL